MKARKKPVEIEFFTFEEFVKFGKNAHDATKPYGGELAWSFTFKEHPITHENDECYLIPTLEGTHRFTPSDVLIVGVKGEIYPCKKDIFEMTYDLVENNSLIVKTSNFEQLVKPLIKWLKENHSPHTRIIVDNEYGELVNGVKSVKLEEK
jgi:hypothetical protein